MSELTDCGCCEGITALVPEAIANRSGLDRVLYRVGTHPEFFASALAALSDPQFAALRNLSTRETDDFTIALLDGWASLADVLTFYQERLANESWLRTATERDSVLRLAELVGYKLKPGVAAQTVLSFSLDETPGAPGSVTVEIGTRVQSVPGADQKPQTFETIENLDARVEWNALRPMATTPPLIAAGVESLYLKGTATNLQPGDPILILGDERDQSVQYPDKERWDLRILLTVTPDAKADRTLVTWERGLGEAPTLPASKNVRLYALRQRAALFGHNAPDPRMLGFNSEQKSKLMDGDDWKAFGPDLTWIDLDNEYSKIVALSWVALVNSAGYVEAYKAKSVSYPSRAAFGISGKVTRLVPDTTEHLDFFRRRETIVYAQSEQLETTSGPLLIPPPGSLAAALTRDPDLLAPVEGNMIALDRLVPVLEPGRRVIVTGKRLRVRVAAASLSLVSTDGLQMTTVLRGDFLILKARPSLLGGGLIKWNLLTPEGLQGEVTTRKNDLVLTAAADEDSAISELAVVQDCSGNPTVLTLQSPPLASVFDRATVTIAANVANATHGETVSEILGSGDAGQSNQRFDLQQSPLTYVRSQRADGAASTLEIRVNDLLWHEVPSLFGRSSHERIYTLELADDGTSTVQFGDGFRGARLPSGPQNVKAKYRRGIGLEGLVTGGQLTTLLTRPPGLKAAINPLPAEGAEDPEPLANARQNTPLTVLTLERVVSLEDYENYSRSYAGIAKTLATWTWDGRTRGVFVTVAAPGGAAVSRSLAQALIGSIHDAGDPFVPVRVESYEDVRFRLAGQIRVDPDYEVANVFGAVIDLLRTVFSFERRAFGQPVMLSEVIALAQSVAGVVAVNLTKLYRTGAPPARNSRLEANLPAGGDPASLIAAELLTLDPASPDLEVMP